MANDNTKQIIKGDNNSQTTIVVRGNYQPGLNKEEVLQLIKDTCLIDRDAVVDIVKDIIDDIEPENRVVPDKRVFVPAINQLCYSLDDEVLKNAYKKLLKSSLSLDSFENVHPSFISIISQLNSDEIKLLNALPTSSVVLQPLIDVRMKIGKQAGLGIKQVSNFSDIGYGICQFPNKICSYIENLERLKLIEIPNDRYIMDNDKYQQLIDHPVIQAIMNKNQSTEDIIIQYEFDKKYFNLTNFGIQFLQCCR